MIDLQKGLRDIPTVHPMDEIVARSASLAAAFRRHGLPVVLVNVAGGAPGRTEVSRPAVTRPAVTPPAVTPPAVTPPAVTPPPDWTDLVEELDVQPDDHLITKHRWGAFHGTSLDADLRDHGVTQVVVVGVATSAGVESTARSAYEHGYHVVVATDAMTDRSADAHRNSTEGIFPKLGETATTEEILEMLDKTHA